MQTRCHQSLQEAKALKVDGGVPVRAMKDFCFDGTHSCSLELVEEF